MKKWTEENTQKLIYYFNQGYDNHELAAALDVNIHTLVKNLYKLQAEGVLPKRPTSDVDAEIHAIKQMIEDGLSTYEMACKLKVSKFTIGNRIKVGIERGIIPADWKNYKRSSVVTVGPTFEDKQVVRCTAAVSHQCVYGISQSVSSFSGLCRYIQCENRMRGCSWKACNKFQKVTKNNPRKSIREEKPIGKGPFLRG